MRAQVSLSGVAFLSENVCHVTERLTRVFHSGGTTVEMTFISNTPAKEALFLKHSVVSALLVNSLLFFVSNLKIGHL